MPTITRFEDLEAWQRARSLTRRVYQLSGSGRFARDGDLKSQIRRAATSTMANIAEGFERDGNAESGSSSPLPKAPWANSDPICMLRLTQS